MLNILNKKKILIGMIHLPPLLTFEGFPGIDDCIKKALEDLKMLEGAGFDAVLIENDDDKPSTEFANSAQVACFALIASAVAKQSKIPVGIQVMLNDWKSSIEIASLIKAEFIRIDVFVDKMTSEWGDIIVSPNEIIQYKNKFYPELLIFSDIQVKHKTILEDKSLTQSAIDAKKHGAHAIIVSGNFTGEETPVKKIEEVKVAMKDFPVLVGSGANKYNIVEQLKIADGTIVGTSIKNNGSVDIKKATEFVNIANKK